MEILGIGAPELIFILIIALIVLGPRDMQKAGRTVGRWLNQLIRSDGWKVFQKTSSELRNLPRNLMREANLEAAEMERELRNAIDPRIDPNPDSAQNKAAPRPNVAPPRKEYPVAGEAPTPKTDVRPPQDGADDLTGSK
jgi:sec-independent protein translocase protein TatB